MNVEDIKKEEEKLLSENLTADEKKFPSLFVQTRNLMKQAWLSGTDVFKGKALMSTPEKAAARLEICSTCEFFHETRCLKCGCYMHKKAHLESATCPLNKWGDLQNSLSIATDVFPKSGEVSIDEFPEQDRNRVLQTACHAALNKTNFFIDGKKYFSKIQPDNSVKIFRPAKNININSNPRPQSRNIVSGFTKEEQSEFYSLVNQTKNSGARTFSFRGINYVVKVENSKTSVSLVPKT
jgi:hypothetical protein